MHHRRRKHHKRRHHRRVGAFSLGRGDTGLKLLSVAGGFFLAGTINTQIDKLLPKDAPPAGSTTPSTVVSKTGQMMGIAGQVGIGGLLLMRKRSNKVMTIAGGVLAGAGLKRALAYMGVMSGVGGFQSVPVIGSHRMAGYQSVPVIGARTVPAQLAGAPAQLQGYRPAGSGVGAYVPAGSGVMGSIGSCESGSGITNNGSGYMN